MVFQICQGNARGNSQGTVANDEMHSNHTIVDVTVWFQICQGNVANDECAQSFLSRLNAGTPLIQELVLQCPPLIQELVLQSSQFCAPPFCWELPTSQQLVAMFGVPEFSCWSIHHKVYADRIHNRNKDKRAPHERLCMCR